MLTDLHIRNFAIAEDVAIEFDSGMTVLTGETGAGKSILVGALGLVLGDRADSSSVRSGARQAEITASFDISGLPAVGAWLGEHDLQADDDECHLRRVISAAGRSRAYINGHSVALQSLREVGETLMDIHGQHEHQSMLRPRAQRALLDAFGGYEKELNAVREAFEHWYRLDQQLTALRSANADRDERLEILRFQVRELEQLELTEGEVSELMTEQKRIGHLAGLAEGVSGALEALSGDDNAAQDRLGAARRTLAPLLEVDPALGEAIGMLDEAQIQIDEANDALARYAEDLDMDPAERDRIEARLDRITDVSRKHRVAPPELPARLSELRERLDGLEDADNRLEELTTALADAEQAYRSAAAALTRKRKSAARKLANAAGRIVRELGMPGAEFHIEVGKRDSGAFSRDGADLVTFGIAANPGEPSRPIAKVASGGELSRISLAIGVITAKLSRRRCMVFDEVDAGIGGAVAQIVGQQLRDLAGSAQVLCVTHLPQVASQSHHHYKVAKAANRGKTRSAVQPLDEKQKIEELARMLGGVKITDTTRRHAAELLAQGRESG